MPPERSGVTPTRPLHSARIGRAGEGADVVIRDGVGRQVARRVRAGPRRFAHRIDRGRCGVRAAADVDQLPSVAWRPCPTVELFVLECFGKRLVMCRRPAAPVAGPLPVLGGCSSVGGWCATLRASQLRLPIQFVGDRDAQVSGRCPARQRRSAAEHEADQSVMHGEDAPRRAGRIPASPDLRFVSGLQ